MLQNVLFKAYDQLEKQQKTQNNTFGTESVASAVSSRSKASADSKNVSETKDPFGEAATLELSKDSGRQGSLYSNMIYTSNLLQQVRLLKLKVHIKQ